MDSTGFDYIIVGAGPAGCVLAHRLSADPHTRVLLLEAGPHDRHPLIRMPAGFARLLARRALDWGYLTTPQARLDDRTLWWPRGRVLGGSGSIDAMCYVRGVAADYDGWAAQGADGWRWDDVLPCFRRSEDNVRGASELHGVGGPLAVSDQRHPNPLSQAFVDAAQEAGLGFNADFNGIRQEGVGYYQVTQRDGERCSAATAYLHPVRSRPNLVVHTGALASRITFDRRRATGVTYGMLGKAFHQAAAREVILCGGAINSPQLLMLSGIGPAAELRRHRIEVVAALAQVGGNLQAPLGMATLRHCTRPVSYDRIAGLKTALGYYLRGHRGPGGSNLVEAGGFVRSALAPDGRADIQLGFVPAMLDPHGRQGPASHGYTLHACHLRPRSRGRVTLVSNRIGDKPRIEPGHLGDPEGFDLRMLVECARLSRDILARRAFDGHRGDAVLPARDDLDDGGLAAFVRARAETAHQPAGTCRMGSDDAAVVDPQLRVRGVESLRVVDASVMPTLVGGGLNAPVMMLAERAADLIREGR